MNDILMSTFLETSNVIFDGGVCEGAGERMYRFVLVVLHSLLDEHLLRLNVPPQRFSRYQPQMHDAKAALDTFRNSSCLNTFESCSQNLTRFISAPKHCVCQNEV